MSLALVGAHRTGKSTLAKAFAQKHDVPFVQTGASEVFASLGLDPKAEYPIAQRIAVQAAILYAFERQWLDASRRSIFYVSDRSPLDLASYLLADVTRQTLAGQPEVADAVNGYVDRCVESANRFFHTIVLIQPGIPLVEAAGKAPACPAYMEHLNLLQSGLLRHEKLHAKTFMLPRQFTDMEDRMSALTNTLAGVATEYHAGIGRLIREGAISQH